MGREHHPQTADHRQYLRQDGGPDGQPADGDPRVDHHRADHRVDHFIARPGAAPALSEIRYAVAPASCTAAGSRAAAAAVGTTTSEVGRWLRSRSVTLPTSIRFAQPFPCDPTTNRSVPHSVASRRIVSTAIPYRTIRSTPDVRINDH